MSSRRKGKGLTGWPIRMQTLRCGQLRNRVSCAALLALALVSTLGCSATATRLGLRVRLDSVPVTAVSASLVNKRGGSMVSALGPGQSAQLVVVARTRDGQQFATVGSGHGKVALDNYTIEAAVIQVSKSGTVSLSSDPRVSDGKVGHLRITPVAHPDVVAEIDIPVRYDMAFSADFSGVDGAKGFDGTDGFTGSSGADGRPAMVDPTTGALGTQGPGGRGSDGGNGGDGSNGQDGTSGGAVHLWIRLESGTTPLLQIKASSGSRQSFYLVDPNGGSLRVIANGGAGGRGGSGGKAGRGGSGGVGFPNGPSGLDGQSGWDGRAGAHGAAGTITISVDPRAQPFMKCISWSNYSGGGVAGPAPKIIPEPVPALW
ncbi:MAG: hypothetical protein M3O41_04045 [Pseudomonadota bacterium]|nr:hypothetical protein [Pseudomonadota bacterium]